MGNWEKGRERVRECWQLGSVLTCIACVVIILITDLSYSSLCSKLLMQKTIVRSPETVTGQTTVVVVVVVVGCLVGGGSIA